MGTQTMRLDEALSGVSCLGIDTAPFIYFVERHPDYLDLIREVIRRIDAGELTAVSSVVTLTEVLTQPLRFGNFSLAQKYRNVLYQSRNFKLVQIDADIAEIAAELRSRYNLRTPDALQLAAAIKSGCDAFLTNDATLKKVAELKVLVLSELKLN
ncbi:MAG: type II toxin-antitoxin system VapC family toxin [Armatimonadetes bacterium]|nr:type II toxin-antitoxin system VapC family toxin [Armatimonadota bacterium]